MSISDENSALKFSVIISIPDIIKCITNTKHNAINQLYIDSLYFALSAAVELNNILIPKYTNTDSKATIAIFLKDLYHEDLVTFKLSPAADWAILSACWSPSIIDVYVLGFKKFMSNRAILFANIFSGEYNIFGTLYIDASNKKVFSSIYSASITSSAALSMPSTSHEPDPSSKLWSSWSSIAEKNSSDPNMNLFKAPITTSPIDANNWTTSFNKEPTTPFPSSSPSANEYCGITKLNNNIISIKANIVFRNIFFIVLFFIFSSYILSYPLSHLY